LQEFVAQLKDQTNIATDIDNHEFIGWKLLNLDKTEYMQQKLHIYRQLSGK
jgi:hypothetical protein